MNRRTLPLAAALIALLAAAPSALQDSSPPSFGQAKSMFTAAQTTNDWAPVEDAFRWITNGNTNLPPRKIADAWFCLGYALHQQGETEEALPCFETSAATSWASREFAMYNAACAHALLGNPDPAFAWLAKARSAGFFASKNNESLLQTDPELENLRSDPRWDVFSGNAPAGPFLEYSAVPVHEWIGETAGDQFGWEGKNVGDCNGDGIDDALISAPYFGEGNTNRGKVYLYSGKTGDLLFSRVGQPGELYGYGISGGGDVNGDGRPDLIVGAPQPNGGAGRVEVLSGTDGQVLLELQGAGEGDNFGDTNWCVGDWNDDGYADVLVGSTGFDGAGDESGRAQLFSGRDGSLLLTLDGESGSDNFGSAVSGRVRGDEKLLVIGAMNAGQKKNGRVYIYSGNDAKLVATLKPDGSAINYGQYFTSIVGDVDNDGHLDVFSSDFNDSGFGQGAGRFYVHSGVDGKRIKMVPGKGGEGLGISNAHCGDVNGDGHDDLIVGAYTNSDAGYRAGKAYLYSGKDFTVLREFTGSSKGDSFGSDATAIGDVNGDGAIDFLITAAYSNDAGGKTGRAYVVSGAAGPAGL